MSNDKTSESPYARLWKLWAMICKMIMDGARDPQKVAEVLQSIVDEKVEEAKGYLRELYYDLELDTVETPETFQSSGVFNSGVHGVATVPKAARGKSSAVKVSVSEIILPGKFSDIFGSQSVKRRRFTESQVIGFCRKHRDKLRTFGYGTFFEMEGGVVARVDFEGDELFVIIYSCDYGDGWDARSRRRVVSIQ